MKIPSIFSISIFTVLKNFTIRREGSYMIEKF